MNPDQLTLSDVGELAPVETFARTANRQKASFGIIRRAPWDSWQMSRVAKFVKFTETYCVAPIVRTLITLHPYQIAMYERWLDPTHRAGMEKIPRGNAKTTSAGAFVVCSSYLDTDTDVPIVATTVKQAEKTTYGAVLSMLGYGVDGKPTKGTSHPEIHDRAHVFTSVADKRAVIPQTNSVIYPIADAPGPLQGLNPRVAVLDEASEADIETWDALRLASGKRPESLVLGISTPSFKLEGNAMLDFEEALAAGITTPGVYFYEHTAPKDCDHRDEANWLLANPALSTVPPILAIDALRADIGVMGEQRFRCYRLAQWPTMVLEGWLGPDGPDIWHSLDADYTPCKGRRTFAGVDVSLHHDSTAVVFMQETETGRWHAWCKIFYPDSGVVDQAFVKECIRDAWRAYDLGGVAYDPRFFESAAQDLDAEGIPMIEVPQTAARMVPAVAAGYRMIIGRQITHDADQAFGRQVVNAKARPSEGGITISKSPKTRGLLKCDAAIAFCLAASLVEFGDDVLNDDMLAVH